ncbi:MAG: sulfatase [Planctomycetota bacterium]
MSDDGRILVAAIALSLLAACSVVPLRDPQEARPPNVVILFADDLGYGDLSCYGNPTIHTPNLDALAAGGMKLTQFYVAAPLCSPSRAALLTGCYPKRVGMQRQVIFPQDDHGLHTDEVTIADMLHDRGYATAAIGKWHLGHRPGLLPTDQGFDEFFGLPYSNDMSQFHRKPGSDYRYRLPLMEGTKVVEWEPDQHLLTRRYTERAVAFVDAHHDAPFFLYLPYTMPHIPIYASDAFVGTSARGTYGDVVQEIDWSVGQVIAALRRHGIEERTLVLFTSDNGPWLPYKLRGGSAGPLRGGKGTNWEGGQREPCIVSWPGTIPAGSLCPKVCTSMDVLPTVAALCPAPPTAGRVIDGHDIGALLRGEPGARSPTHQFLYYSSKGDLAAIRRGPYKLMLANAELYDVEQDIGEQWNIAEQHADLVAELKALAEKLDADITAEARPVRRVEETAFDPVDPAHRESGAADAPVVAPVGSRRS